MCFFGYMATKKEKHNCNTNIKYGPDVTASQILRPLLAKPRENQKPKNLEKTKKQKNQNFSENVWSKAHVWFFFWFSSSFFVFFGHDLEKTKKTQGFFWFFGGTLTWSKPKNQKNSGLFWFFAWIVFTCLLKICPKNQKRPEFFLFFWLTSSKSSSKKTKNLDFF